MSVYASKAESIANNLVTVHGADAGLVKASPFLDIITQILQSLLPMLVGCLPKPTNATDLHLRMKSLTVWDHMYIRRQIRRDIDSPQVFQAVGAQLQIEVGKAAAAMTLEETKAAMDEAAAA